MRLAEGLGRGRPKKVSVWRRYGCVNKGVHECVGW